MTEERKKKESIFGPHPFFSKRSSAAPGSGVKRKGWSPFPRKLTDDEKKARALKKAQKRKALTLLIEKGKYDKVTVMISKGLLEFIGLFMAKLYLTRSRMFNFMIVGASGTILNWFLFNLFRLLVPMEFIAFVFAVLCAFLWNYMWNEAWTFKYKNIEKSEDSINGG